MSLNTSVEQLVDGLLMSPEFKKVLVQELESILAEKENIHKHLSKILDTKSETPLKTKPEPVSVTTICIEYGPRGHALFGDFRKQNTKFKDEFLNKTKWVKPNATLHFGFGWVFPYKCLDDIRKALKKYNVTFVEKTRKEMEREESKKTDSKTNGDASKSKDTESSDSVPENVSEDSEDSESEVQSIKESDPEDDPEDSKPEPKSAGTPKSGKEKNPSATKTSAKSKTPVEEAPVSEKIRAKPNKYKNRQISDTDYVVDLLPLGDGDKKSTVIIGVQGESDDQTGYDTVLPLEPSDIETCRSKGWKPLTPELVKSIKNKALKTKLQAILDRQENSEELTSD